MIYPLFAMFLLTLIVAVHLLRLRVAAVKSGEVRLSSFRLNNATDFPNKMLQASRNYSNLFEMPVLFYLAALLAMVLKLESGLLLGLAWLFVLSRVAHSWIHVTYNNVLHRLAAFMVGNICILLMWILLLLAYNK